MAGDHAGRTDGEASCGGGPSEGGAAMLALALVQGVDWATAADLRHDCQTLRDWVHFRSLGEPGVSQVAALEARDVTRDFSRLGVDTSGPWAADG